MTPEKNDPTRAGFTPPATGATSLSANEVEALCSKAVRGAGLSWGLAEEAGFVARWLHARGIDGPGAVLSYLDWLEAPDRPVARPEISAGEIHAEPGSLLCPIVLGCVVSDFALPGPARSLLLGDTLQPVLLLAAVHHRARLSGTPLKLVWPGGALIVTPNGTIEGNLADLEVLKQAGVELLCAAATGRQPDAPPIPAKIDATTLQRLNDYAMRTTVPASKTSRADAGAGTGDND